MTMASPEELDRCIPESWTAHQASLPDLPIPPIAQSLDLFFDCVAPLVSAEELAEAKRAAEELTAFAKATPHACEVFGSDYGQTETKPYFDLDVWTEQPPTDEQVQHYSDMCLAELQRLFPEVKPDDIAISARHGPKTKALKRPVLKLKQQPAPDPELKEPEPAPEEQMVRIERTS